ncbi:MAG: hypothetical protein KJ069_29090 [Anaerolineae bacterium]|nr:hypothetical protein [Anaerolineae bacterium]
MTGIPIHESRQDRYGKTEKKTLTLTNEAIESIQAYADRHGLYFSVAIESLALMALGQTTAETLPRLVANLLQRTINWQFNRFARLLAQAVIATEEVNYKADVLVMQTIWREARLDPANFIQKLQVSHEPHVQPDAKARRVKNEICADAHEEAVAQLKKSLGLSDTLWEQEGADET